MLINDFLKILERLAPASLAEDWDSVGLQTGSRADETDAVLLALNVNDEVLDEAAGRGCRLILTHHPLIFSPLVHVGGEDVPGRLVARAVREGIAVVAAHTNLDAARGGLADVLAELLGLRDVMPLVGGDPGWSKLVVFVPPADLEPVRAALFEAGAGEIGDYHHCSWAVAGKGSFLAGKGAHPAVGEVGREQQVEELRLEMVFPTFTAEAMVAALVEAHSYEEPAFDIYPLKTRGLKTGAGRVGELDSETPLADLASMAAELFGLPEARFSCAPGRRVRRMALVPGSGAGLMAAAAAAGAEALITGDLKYHQALAAADLDLSLIDVPHDASETVALKAWLPRLKRELEELGVEAVMSAVATDPWRRATRRQRPDIHVEKEDEMYHLYIDGGARGNPGPAGVGAVLVDAAGKRVDQLSEYIGEATNNAAEYQALIAGLRMALDRGIRRLAIFSDSELIVRQVQGSYKVKNEGLIPFHLEVKSLLSRLDEYTIKSIPRESNEPADRLVNRALDEASQ